MLSDIEIRVMSNCEIYDLIRSLEDEIKYRENLPEKELSEYLNKSNNNFFESLYENS
jgi:hypothetical protein